MAAQPGESVITIKDTTANPAPLGLLGFGMTTVLLNIHNAGIYELGTMILAMGIFYGGMAQIIAGIMEWKKNNTFGTTAFSSYGLFWLTLVGLLLFKKWGWWEGTSDNALAWYFLAWGFFTFCMFIGTLKLNRALQTVFLTLTVLFLLLAIRDWTGSEVVGKIAGWEGIVCGLSAIYAAVAQIWNEVYGRVVLPLGPVKK
ncbi:MAG: acetate uptake transporter [Actinobacteria bacterium]|nr:acetate uptake transporter [Actinomycetota bacterium]OPZ76330.1 MAG: Inner membrane protein YaaH [Actinobacteria bacterium ADurb.Bin444]